ncbi:AbrB/MazE/SpoVT family DNA-binding domain-containing protein [Nocardia terpenica]|uniref:AbrB/MazE/SpoVT family DNA-binding domain-containing protein n=1 Tax=Nocardia terpenica TaxID=455432 RepID=A0A6G9ZEA2_9NOCA|nr:AbrB/MazE/SpoVT family DNA-binding domain-containing protein [Nocardia terpenica]QIS23731.1 hypothetical protein F6W96_41065 [Nocardia terpenica]
MIPGDYRHLRSLAEPGSGSSGARFRELPLIAVREQHTPRAHYALRPIDSQGRITDRSLAVRMGWVPGQRLQWRIDGGVIVLSPADHGPARVTNARHLRLPARVCQAAAIRTGDRILFVVRSDATCLIAIPPKVVDEMVTARLADVAEGGAA